MNEVMRRLIRERHRNEIDPYSPEPVWKVDGHRNVQGDLFVSLDHYLPKQFITKETELHGSAHAKKVVVRSKWNTRVVYRQPGTGKLITTQETTGENEETISIPVEEDQSAIVPNACPLPPLNAEYILHLFLKADERDAVIGDLLERYASKHERFGERRAQFWFYGEVARSLWPLLKRLIARAGGLIALGEWIRRHVS